MRDNRIQGPNLDEFEGNWNKWAAYVLNSIHELKYDIERIFDLLTDRDANRVNNCPFRHRIESLENRMSEQERAVMGVNVIMARWSGAIIAVNALIAAGITLLKHFIK